MELLDKEVDLKFKLLEKEWSQLLQNKNNCMKSQNVTVKHPLSMNYPNTSLRELEMEDERLRIEEQHLDLLEKEVEKEIQQIENQLRTLQREQHKGAQPPSSSSHLTSFSSHPLSHSVTVSSSLPGISLSTLATVPTSSKKPENKSWSMGDTSPPVRKCSCVRACACGCAYACACACACAWVCVWLPVLCVPLHVYARYTLKAFFTLTRRPHI